MNEATPTNSNQPESVYGEIGLWIAILADLTIFTLMFATVLYYRGFNPELYVQSQARLDQFIALINTLLLLTSSFFVVLSIHKARSWDWPMSGRFLLAGMACGVGFIGMKFIEYGDKFEAGINLRTNEFFMFYFMTTILHLVHVLIGLGVLTIIRLGFPARGVVAKGRLFALEAGGVFWHMVDLLWVILMAVVYLAR